MSNSTVIKITGIIHGIAYQVDVEIPLRPLAVFIAGMSGGANCMHEPTILKVIDTLKGPRSAPL